MGGIYGVVKGRCPCDCANCKAVGEHEVSTGWESDEPKRIEYYCPEHPNKVVVRNIL